MGRRVGFSRRGWARWPGALFRGPAAASMASAIGGGYGLEEQVAAPVELTLQYQVPTGVQ